MRNPVISIVCLVLGVCGLAQADLNDGLVAYYPFNGNANDESGNGNDGVVVGPFSFLNEKDYFTPNGNSRIEAPHLPSTNSYPITISARIRSSNPEASAVFVSQYANGSWNGYELSGGSSVFKGFFYRNSSNGIDFTTNEFEADQWYSVVFTVAEDGGRLFVNGQLDDTGSWSREPVNATSTNPLIIGSREGFYANDVDIDDVRIYDRALSAQEVATLHAIESKQFRVEVIEGNFTWQEAKADAETKGGRLAVLDTQEKIDAANTYLEDLGEWPVMWIGLTDESEEGVWKWIDNTPLTAQNWENREPNNSFGGAPEHYAVISNSSRSRDKKWNDLPPGAGLDFAGNPTGSYLFEILVQEPAPPVVELDPFYESNPLEEIVVDATPSKGFPDNFTYQWSFDDFEVPAFLGGAEPTLSLLGTSDQNGTWKVVISNSVGSTEASFEYRMFEDNDADGISNYREENITLTNPDNADSDSDGLLDPEEVYIHETDPNIADVDEDGLNDSEEIDAATDPSVADSDNDGLSDGLEVKTYSSNPNKADTDGDGIADAAEVAADLDINTAESIADAVAFLTEELTKRPPVDGFEDAVAEARASGRNDVTSAPSDYDLYKKEAYNAVVAERDARPTLAQYSEVLVERDARPSVVAYNAVVADRDSRPTKEAYDTVVSERDARLTLEEVKDGRLGSVLLLPDTATNKVRLRFCIEESNGLGQWITREEEAEVDVPLAPGKKFFRFSVKENE